MTTNIKFKFILLISVVFFLSFQLEAQTINWQEFVSKSDIIWNNNLDSSFFNGAFVGDGVQGGMITQDSKNPNGIRMMLGHYKAVAHNYISGVDMCDSRVFIGDVVLTPIGTATRQTMRLDIWSGEVTGIISTNKGEISWKAIADRKNNCFLLIVKTSGEESGANISFRERWAVSTAFYGGGKLPENFINSVGTKPLRTKNGDIDIVTSKMKNRGAQAITTQLIKNENSQVFYVTIGTDDISDLNKAVENSVADATKRLNISINEGETTIVERNKTWWNNYMKSSYFEVKQDPYWQKFWWLQVYKFGCTSSEKAGLLIDTQGPWTTQCGWSAIWWNLNVQLSYYPMYSANKLEVGRSLVDGIDRIYKAGAFRSNASSFGGKPGGMVGRSTAYDGKGTWGDEFGNLPWALQCYYKYWKYSGDDNVGKNLFPILKQSTEFLISLLTKEADGKYHVKEGRSPEYDDSKLYKDANYTLMSIDWSLKALLELDSLFAFNDPLRTSWKEKLENLLPFPANANGYMVNPAQGFDKGHRHYSHLLAIYPYHTVTIDDNPQTKSTITNSVNRWIDLTTTSGAAGYTFTGGCAMYATLGNGDKALNTLEYLKPKIHPNTMYEEGMNPVIETPLSGVESIGYLLLQSYGGKIRIFPALPAKWENVRFKDFRAEGAFLVSAVANKGVITDVEILSEKGKECLLINPWKDKKCMVKDENGNRINTVEDGNCFRFHTEAGKRYFLFETKKPVFKIGAVSKPDEGVSIMVTEEIIPQNKFSGFSLKINNTECVIDSIKLSNTSNSFILFTNSPITNQDTLTGSYTSGNVLSIDSLELASFSGMLIENLLHGSAPRITHATTNFDGTQIQISFSKSLLKGSWHDNSFGLFSNGIEINVDSLKQSSADSLMLILYPAAKLFNTNKLKLKYAGSHIKSKDLGLLHVFDSVFVSNFSPGEAPRVMSATVTNSGLTVLLTLNKNITDISSAIPFFSIKINDVYAKIDKVTSDLSKITINLKTPVRYGDAVFLNFVGSSIGSSDGGELKEIKDQSVSVPLMQPVYYPIAGKIEAEKYSVAFGVQTEGTSDTGGGQNVGYIESGDWLDFAVDVKQEGMYECEYRVAGQGIGKIILQIPAINGSVNLDTINFPATGGWQTWISAKSNVQLKQGKQILRVFFANGQTNINWINFKLVQGVGINELKEDGIIIYPNPTRSELNIQTVNKLIDRIEIIDISGKILFSKKVNNQQFYQIDLALANGFYTLRISNKSQSVNKQFFVQN